MTDVWESGKTYVPGSLVKPSTSGPPTSVQPTDAGFESGALTNWTAAGAPGWVVATDNPYSGTYAAKASGGGIGTLTSNTEIQVAPGDAIQVDCRVRLTNSGVDDLGAQAAIVWLDASHAVIGSPVMGSLIYGKGGFWTASTCKANAPGGGAYFKVQLSVNTGSNGGNVEFDSASVTYYRISPPAGMIFKATQAAPGKSGTSEPTWPTTAGVSVTDNEVIWEGVIASRLTWVASPLLETGGTEPVWPLNVGGIVRDGTVDWVAVSRRIEDKNCPNSKIVAIAAGKIYAGDGDRAPYSSTVNPLDWTTKDDAGFLPFGLNTYGSNPIAAMGLYRSNVVIFNAEGFQMYQVDTDPANTTLLDALPVASTHHKALAPVANDLLFLSSLGVRSIGIAASSTNLQAGDVGMPVDALVQPAMAARPGGRYIATYYPGAGQYWLAFPDYLSIVGNIPDGAVGDQVSYQYGVDSSRAYTVALLSGALPTGLSMGATGKVTGTLTGPGAFSWNVSATNTTSDVATLSDAANVSLRTSGVWLLLGTSNNATVDFSTSPDTWPITRSLSVSFNVKQSQPAWNGSALAVLTTTPSSSVAIIQSQTVAGSTVTDSVVALPFGYTRISGFQNLFIAWDGVNPYAYSSDSGATWTTVAGPSSLLLSGIARMASGRWIAFFRSGATQQLYYSDQAIPTTWTLALGGVSGTGNYDIATDGTTAVFTNNVGNAYISTDGAAWAASGAFVTGGQANVQNIMSPAKGVFIAYNSGGVPYSVVRSTDSGATWSLIAMTGATGAVKSMSSHEGTIAAQTAGEEFVSTDNGATWVKPARAPLTSALVAYLGAT